MSHSFPRAGRLKELVGIVGWLMLLEAGTRRAVLVVIMDFMYSGIFGNLSGFLILYSHCASSLCHRSLARSILSSVYRSSTLFLSVLSASALSALFCCFYLGDILLYFFLFNIPTIVLHTPTTNTYLITYSFEVLMLSHYKYRPRDSHHYKPSEFCMTSTPRQWAMRSS